MNTPTQPQVARAFGKVLATCRHTANISQEELADWAGMDRHVSVIAGAGLAANHNRQAHCHRHRIEHGAFNAGDDDRGQIAGGTNMSHNQQMERALNQALACREDRKRAEETLAAIRRKEEEAIEHLQALVQGRETQQSPGGNHG